MNYIGSKKNLSDWIFSIIESKSGNLQNKKFTDLFAGTGIISKIARQKGAIVYANDLQYYSYILLKRIVEGKNNYKGFIDIVPKEGVITKLYAEDSMYFTKDNAMFCDGALKTISLMNEEDKIAYLSALIEGMDKVANTASVYGAYLKKYKKTSLNKVKPVVDNVSGIIGKAFNCKAEDLISRIDGDILYLDPPYNSRQYSSNYHVLETIARMDNPSCHGKTMLRDDCQKSFFSSKEKVNYSLEKIIREANFKFIFMSYNNEGLLSFDKIKEIFSKYGNYSMESLEYKKFNSGSGTKTSKTIEYIHILEK